MAPAAPAPTRAPAGRAQPVARPAIPTAARLRALSGEQVIEQLMQFTGTSESGIYGRGLCYLELSQPRRYRDEFGFSSFEELCKARKLPSRMTARKQIAVVSTYTEPEMKQLGGMERCYTLVLYFRKQNSDPRRALAPNARVLGRALKDMSTSDIERVMKEGSGPSEKEMEAARNVAERLKRALRRAEMECRMRTHLHGKPCVAPHMMIEAAEALAKALTRLSTLEKKLGG